MSKFEVKSEAGKYTNFKASMESIVLELEGMKNSVNDNFQGRTQDEMIESLNLLRNMSLDLSGELGAMKTSLDNLYDDIVQEEKRRERIRKEKEEKKRREEEKNKS